jgi:hypothetical protein
MATERRTVPYGIIAFVLLGIVFAGFVLPQYRLGWHRSERNDICNNLRQLQGAKEQWALEHGKTGDVMVTREDVTPYLRVHDGWVPIIVGEQYTLNSLTQSAQAVLTHKVRNMPKGTILRLTMDTNGGTDYILLPTNGVPR